MRRDDRGRGGDRRGGGRGGGRGRTDYKIEVLDLPSGTSWQDLKDFFKTIGDVLYAGMYVYGCIYTHTYTHTY
jgi:arginine/serine-rich splicing factor 4/5/6